MLSMTGYGEATAQNDRLRVETVLRGVNHRFLDVALRMPDDLRPHESRIKEAVAARVRRGRVEMRLELRRFDDPETTLELHRGVLESLSAVAEKLRREGIIEGRPTFGDLLRFPELLRVHREAAPLPAEDVDLVLSAIDDAVASFLTARAVEGEKVRLLLAERLAQLAALSDRLEELSGAVSRELENNLRQRIDGLSQAVSVPEERLAQEVLVLLERADVREELDRLRTHISTFGEVVEGEGPCGKRLDFLAQEILRELNTLAAKCRSTSMVGSVLEAKLICEQLREQVQNVE